MACNTKYGKIVWAKVKGSCPWPAKAIEPIPEIKRPVRKGNWFFVRFYGSNDHAWVDYDTHVWPYKDYRVRYGDKDKATSTFKDGLQQADLEYESLPEEDLPTIDEELSTIFPNSVPPPKPSTKKNKTIKKRKSTSSIKSLDKEPVKKPSTVQSNGPAEEKGTSRTISSPSETHVTSPRSPRLSAASRIGSKRTADIKASVYDFVDNEPSLSANQTVKNENIKATDAVIGFLGLGNMGQPIVRNLIKYGHKVGVWNRSDRKVELDANVQIYDTPAALVADSDITIACLADPIAVKEVLFCKNGVLEGISDGKGFVDLSTVDVETVTDAEEQIHRLGGLYLEAPISGSKTQAMSGSLLIMCSGDEELYKKCASCFQAIASKTYFLGSVGAATRAKLSLASIQGSIVASVAEGMTLAERAGIRHRDMLDILISSPCGSQLVNSTARSIIDGDFSVHSALKHTQKDLRLAIDMADVYDQPLFVTTTVNELYKKAKSLGLSNMDSSMVYKAVSK